MNGATACRGSASEECMYDAPLLWWRGHIDIDTVLKLGLR
jgi:hypothetical protein